MSMRNINILKYIYFFFQTSIIFIFLLGFNQFFYSIVFFIFSICSIILIFVFDLKQKQFCHVFTTTIEFGIVLMSVMYILFILFYVKNNSLLLLFSIRTYFPLLLIIGNLYFFITDLKQVTRFQNRNNISLANHYKSTYRITFTYFYELNFHSVFQNKKNTTSKKIIVGLTLFELLLFIIFTQTPVGYSVVFSLLVFICCHYIKLTSTFHTFIYYVWLLFMPIVSIITFSLFYSSLISGNEFFLSFCIAPLHLLICVLEICLSKNFRKTI